MKSEGNEWEGRKRGSSAAGRQVDARQQSPGLKVDFDTGGSAVDKLFGRSAALKLENDIHRLTVR